MHIYIVGKTEQYIGTKLMGIKFTKKEAQKWCKEQQLKSKDVHTTYSYKKMELNFKELINTTKSNDKTFNQCIENEFNKKAGDNSANSLYPILMTIIKEGTKEWIKQQPTIPKVLCNLMCGGACKLCLLDDALSKTELLKKLSKIGEEKKE